MTARLRRVWPLLAILLIAGCAYFNALYNARRLYRDAEAATNRGDATAAAAAHRESLEKAARSLERDPAGRWADDALLLVAQNHFALGDCRASEAALRRVLRETADPELAARARAYLGASLFCLRKPVEALPLLDEAIPAIDDESPVHAFARLWRARARFEVGMSDSAWSDLDVAAVRRDALGRAARLEQIERALALDESERAVAAFHALLADPAGDLHGDSIRRLAGALRVHWGGAVAREALDPAPGAPWEGAVRDRLVVERARHAAEAGDTALALSELEQAASRSTDEAANAARLLIAQLRLASAIDPAELAAIRAVLLPAIADHGVRPLVNGIGLVGALLDVARRGEPLALFAAAEIARDQLHAHTLARRLFVGYADVAGAGPWSTKALLAARALQPPPAEAGSIDRRIEAARDVYALAALGSAPEGFEESEARLDQTLSGLVARATREAATRDIAIGEAIAEIDSITAAVRADSLALVCVAMADSLGLAGIRRDSVRAACVREDALLVDSFLTVDTLALRDSTALQLLDVDPAALDTSIQ